MTDLYRPVRADLLQLADRLDRAAAKLEQAAEQPGTDPARAHRREQAALVAQETAADLRRAAADPGARPSPEHFARADVIALAAEMDGILIDDRPQADTVSGPNLDPDERRLWAAGAHPTQRRAALIESTRMFGYVTGDPDRRPQVPFWVLGGPRRPDACTCPCNHDAGCLGCGCVCPEPGPCPCCGTGA